MPPAKPAVEEPSCSAADAGKADLQKFKAPSKARGGFPVTPQQVLNQAYKTAWTGTLNSPTEAQTSAMLVGSALLLMVSWKPEIPPDKLEWAETEPTP